MPRAVLVGVGRLTQRRPEKLDDADDAVRLSAKAARLALQDAAVGTDDVDAVYFIDMFGEGRVFPRKGPTYNDPAKDVAKELGLHKVKPENLFKGPVGGNTPQASVNMIAERIANGEVECALITGAEALDTYTLGRKKKLQPRADVERTNEAEKVMRWGDTEEKGQVWGKKLKMSSSQDVIHGIAQMPPSYALLEQGLRHSDGVSEEDRRISNAKLFSGYNKVASASENKDQSWFPAAHSVEEIATASNDNRMVAYPYPKYMCAVMDVNQSASVLIMSEERARALGVPQAKMVYLHGCGDCQDTAIRVLEKPCFDRCFGMKLAGEAALRSAGVSVQDIKYYDVYSCFPVAVRLACREMGIDKVIDIERESHRLTVTGGLPYHGGPGNNYVTHSIAAMVETLRGDPGTFGLVTANGGVTSKHAVGVYSTSPPPEDRPFERPDLSGALKEVQAQYPPRVCARNPGDCTGIVRTFTANFSKHGDLPDSVTCVGDITSGPCKGDRFIAISHEASEMRPFIESPDACFDIEVAITSKGGALGRKDWYQSTFRRTSGQRTKL
ncbi:Hypothetical Protein FCC1311_100211 [Hondaea fermentalgiana]|uniref:Acetyl-CoA acetyltransferase, mitochondrial n=1 Tax=Hondaea fermentalgiana TaxID=2315210 RepID=A0A2R5GW44_9STRA|nr:Hypothetical Protein FCC1311_100211 [Hondaea fermentalgiana]|eukprot:GBG33988.1 Hypothetical Protein FCC1311_100211 [Hondaea fermentalgiana]